MSRGCSRFHHKYLRTLHSIWLIQFSKRPSTCVCVCVCVRLVRETWFNNMVSFMPSIIPFCILPPSVTPKRRQQIKEVYEATLSEDMKPPSGWREREMLCSKWGKGQSEVEGYISATWQRGLPSHSSTWSAALGCKPTWKVQSTTTF